MKKFYVAYIGRSGGDQPIEDVAELGDLPDRDVDLVGDGEAGKFAFGI